MEKKKSTKILWIVLLVFLLVVTAAGASVFAVITLQKNAAKQQPQSTLVYEANVVTNDADALQKAVDALAEQVKEGQMALEMQTQAFSTDGQHFTCYLGNGAGNQYDMFLVLYRDDTQEEIYRSGLIPVGSHIEAFDLDTPLPAGNYDITLVYNQVEEDLETIHAQVNVGLTLIVH